MKRFTAMLAAALLLTLGGCARGTEGSSLGTEGSSLGTEGSSLGTEGSSLGTESSSQAGKPAVSGFDSEALIRQSLAWLDQFDQGSFDDFLDQATPELAKAVTKEQLAAQWPAILAQIGPRKEQLSQEFLEQDGFGVVVLTAAHSRTQLISTFTYDKEGKIAGLNNRTAPLAVEPQQTAAWAEQPITLGYNDHKLNGMLTLPKAGAEKPPVVILLQGSGPSNMDEAVGAAPNRPFADLAHGLAELGIASIRYDKRTYAYPAEFKPADGVEQEYLLDAAEAVALAADDSRVDGARIFLLGHSQGGMLAPRITKDNPKIRGMISLAGTLRGLEDAILDQNRAALAQDTVTPQAHKDAALGQLEAEIAKVKALDPADTTTVLFGMPAAYWNSMNAVDDAAVARELTVPMLILQGATDFQVYADVDYKLWQDTLAGKANVTYHLYPGLGHLFTPTPGDRMDVAVYDAPQTMDSQVIADIGEWIKAN